MVSVKEFELHEMEMKDEIARLMVCEVGGVLSIWI